MSEAIRNKPLADLYCLINSEWPTAKFGSIFTESLERNGKIRKGEALSVSEYHGVIPRDDSEGQRASKEVSNYRVVYPNELAVNYMWLNRGGLGVSRYTGYISPAYKVFKIGTTLIPAYAHYLLRSQPYIQVFSALGTGVRPNSQMVDSTELNALPIPLPPLPTQRAIADYLDRETAEIDGMRADLDEMERLLEERRTNIVVNAFSVLRDLGCSYRKLGYVAQFRNGQDTKGIESVDGAYPVYGSGGAFKRANSYLFDGPSVLFGRKGTLDKPLLVDGKFWTVDTMYYTVLSTDVCPSFLHKWATTIPFEMHSTDTALPSMTSTVLSQLRIPFPPLTEQRRIADEIDRETAEIDSVIENIMKLRDLLVERRAAVISAAVTGQIDIPVSLDNKDEPHA